MNVEFTVACLDCRPWASGWVHSAREGSDEINFVNHLSGLTVADDVHILTPLLSSMAYTISHASPCLPLWKWGISKRVQNIQNRPFTIMM